MAATPTLRFLSLTLPVLLAASACQRDPLEYSPDELQALLDDGELDLPDKPITRAQIAVDGGAAGAAGSGSGTGGSGGSGGSVNPGGRGGVGPGGRGGSSVPDGGGPEPEPITFPTGMWNFDDCNEFRTNLEDSTFSGFTAFRTVRAACVPGVEGQGVSIPGAQDLVYVPDQPVFTFERGVTVAAWVNPNTVKGVRTIFRKRDGLTSAMALMLVEKNWVFVVSRHNALPVAITAPAKAGVFTHVAATYDGNQLKLYLNGQKVAGGTARGTIENGEGPLLLGNDGFQRRLDGTIDKVWFATEAATPATILLLQCLRRPATLAMIPAASEPVSAGTSVLTSVAITNNNHPSCSPEFFQVFNERIPEGFSVQPSFQFVEVPSGQTTQSPVTITSGLDSEPGAFDIGFLAFGGSNFDQLPRTSFTYNVANDGRCRVITSKELMIRAVSVVDDPVRTTFDAPAGDTRRGAWTFKNLMEQLAPSPLEAPALAEAVFRSFTEPQTINGFTVETRAGMRPLILDPWPRDGSGQLDLARAPVRLLAIVNRVDLRNLARGNAGEGRLVFGLLGPGQRPLEATVILEYLLPASTENDVMGWINAWHALGALPFPSEEYNAALQAITDRFTGRGAMPSRPNGSALSQLRTNEIDLGNNRIWELREFTFGAGGMLVPDTVKLTPDRPAFDRTPLLGSFINANEESIVLERHDIPLTIRDGDVDRPFLAGAVFNDLSSWSAPGVNNPEARHKFALNTCNGCHSSQETNTAFLMVFPRVPGQESFLSPFLTGTTTFDPQTGPRTLNDLRRRNLDMRQFACPGEPLPEPMSPPDAGPPDGGMPRPDASVPSRDARMPAPPPPMTTPPPATGPGTGGIPAVRGAPAPAAEALTPKTTLSRGIGRVH